MITQEYSVEGMSCDHCVQAVTSEVSKLDGVAGVQVDLATGTVTVQSATPLPLAAVESALDDAGYDLTP